MSSDRPSYYGAFFWLTLVSFTVPLAVAAKAFHEVRVASKPTPHPDVSGVDHALWDYLLKSYVADGLVNYDGMARDHLFRTYLLQLSEAEPKNLTTSADRLALLCNAYNAFVIDGVITHKINDSVMNFKQRGDGFFDVSEHILFGRTISLNHLEHELIRKRYREPRVHVALVCAAKSCPAIRAEAYVGPRLNRQLEDQANQFANDPRYVAFDAEANTLRLSSILSWYGDDWQSVGGVLRWLGQRVTGPVVQQGIRQAIAHETEVAFLNYDWSLNTQASDSTNRQANTPSAGFGSGSVPNQ